MPKEIRAEAVSTEPPAAVWARVVDGARWPELSPLETFTLEKPGAPVGHGEGVGAIRVFNSGRVASREEIVVREEERRFAYVLLSGLAVKDYRAELELTPEGEGTRLRWHTTFSPKVPGTGWLYRSGIAKFVRPLVEGLATGRATG